MKSIYILSAIAFLSAIVFGLFVRDAAYYYNIDVAVAEPVNTTLPNAEEYFIQRQERLQAEMKERSASLPEIKVKVAEGVPKWQDSHYLEYISSRLPFECEQGQTATVEKIGTFVCKENDAWELSPARTKSKKK